MKKVFILSFLSMLVFVSCRFIGGEQIRGNGVIKTKTISPGSFSAIEAGGAFSIYILQDSSSTARLETDENLLDYIEMDIHDNILEIRTKRDVNLRPSGKIKVFVSTPSLNMVKASGACDVKSENRITSETAFKVKLSGASNVNMDLKAPDVSADLSGAGSIILKGETKNLILEGSGSTDIKCFEMMAENTRVRISGAGDADVFASVSLDVQVSGAGSVRYKGAPTVNQKISGAGSVKKVE